MPLFDAVLSLLCAFVIFVNHVSGQGPVDDYCLNCICANGCAITYNYWVDGGKPTVRGDYPGSESAFENCFNNYDCSARAIQNYMYRYQKDCNGDGVIDCYDHASIHRHGSDECSNHTGDTEDKFIFQVYTCLSK